MACSRVVNISPPWRYASPCWAEENGGEPASPRPSRPCSFVAQVSASVQASSAKGMAWWRIWFLHTDLVSMRTGVPAYATPAWGMKIHETTSSCSAHCAWRFHGRADGTWHGGPQRTGSSVKSGPDQRVPGLADRGPAWHCICSRLKRVPPKRTGAVCTQVTARLHFLCRTQT